MSSKLSHVVERCCHELEIDAVAASKQAFAAILLTKESIRVEEREREREREREKERKDRC